MDTNAILICLRENKLRKKRVDKNQKSVVSELRELGFTVGHTHVVGKGFPDFTVGFKNLNLLVELKSKNGKLTNDEKEFHDKYTGYVSVAFNSTDVINDYIKYLTIIKKDMEHLEKGLYAIRDRHNKSE